MTRILAASSVGSALMTAVLPSFTGERIWGARHASPGWELAQPSAAHASGSAVRKPWSSRPYNLAVCPPAAINDVPPLEVSPTSGRPGMVITVQGEGCVHPRVEAVALELFKNSYQ